MTSAQTDGQNVPPAEFIEHVHAETLIVIQIERQEAIDDLEMILAVPGLDVACLGFMDLSVDMGIPGRIDHPRMIGAIERLIEVAERNGLAAGIIAPDLSIIGRWLAAGMRFVSYSTDALLLSEAAACANRQLRGLPQKGLDSCRRSPPSS
jgi:2-keto-3-deoxy-L-rhamnonate aldolase RhmA